MICGRCSREQNFRPNDCAYCGHEFLRKQSGYWEGGKGKNQLSQLPLRVAMNAKANVLLLSFSHFFIACVLGTRDKRLLRRNDPRKYKRVGKPVKEN